MQRATLPAKQAAEYVGCSYWKLLQMVKAGKIPHIKVGSRVLFRVSSLTAWMAEQEAASVTKQKEQPAYGKLRKIKG